LTRYRTSLVQERSTEVNRLQKTLEGANLTPGNVATDIMGLSGRQMLAALISGEPDAAAIAQVAQGRLRDKLPALERSLVGRVGPHQRFLLAQQPAHIDFLDAAISDVRAEIAERVRTFAWVASPRPPIWPRGRGCARGTTRARASAGAARRGKTARGYARP